VTINDRSVVIAFSKEITAVEPPGSIGIDVNERNVTTSETSGVTKVFDTSEVAEIKERYRVIRAKIGGKTRQDNGIGQKLYTKYGRREKPDRSKTSPTKQGDSRSGQRQGIQHRHGEAERHPETLQERERTRNPVSRTDELLDVPRGPAPD